MTWTKSFSPMREGLAATESPCVADVLGSEFAGMQKTALRLGQNMTAEKDLRRHCQRVWKVTKSLTLGAKSLFLFRLPKGWNLRRCLSGTARHLQ